MNTPYEVRTVTAADLERDRTAVMAEICADGRLRAYGLTPDGPDYARGVTRQLSDAGLDELQGQVHRVLEGDTLAGFWVAEKRADKQIAGLCIAKRLLKPEGQLVFLDRLFVGQDVEGRGVASQLFEVLDVWSNPLPIELEVVEANKRAVVFYERKGFVSLGQAYNHPNFKTELPRLRMRKAAHSGENI